MPPLSGRPSFSSSLRDRIFDGPQIRRMNSCEDALKNVGVVRNIPIRVEKGPTERLCQSTVNISEQLPNNGNRRHSDFPSEFRQTTTFGWVFFNTSSVIYFKFQKFPMPSFALVIISEIKVNNQKSAHNVQTINWYGKKTRSFYNKNNRIGMLIVWAFCLSGPVT